MDLVQTVKKEGSRGGRGEFKWSDVQTSSHRQNYLGHSVMAPTGRWAKGKDLGWYAKGDDASAASEAEARKEEIRRVKEAEQDAMARALGLPVPDRSNPNNQELGSRKEVEKVLKDSNQEDQPGSGGIGFGKNGTSQPDSDQVDRIEGNAEQQDKELSYALKEYKRRHRGERRTGRSRSRSRDRDRDRKHRHRSDRDHERSHRSRLRDRHHRPKRDFDLEHDGRRRRSRSPRGERYHDRRSDRHESHVDRGTR